MSANEQKLYGAIIGAMGGYVLSTWSQAGYSRSLFGEK